MTPQPEPTPKTFRMSLEWHLELMNAVYAYQIANKTKNLHWLYQSVLIHYYKLRSMGQNHRNTMRDVKIIMPDLKPDEEGFATME